MRSIIKIKPTLFFSIIATVSSASAYSQEPANAAAGTSSSANLLDILMGVIALVLAFVIWGMGQVLVTISKQALDKHRQQKNMPVAILLAGMSLLSITANAQTEPAAAAANAANYGGLNSTAFWVLSAVLFIEVVVIGFLMFSIRRIQAELLPQTEKGSTALKEWWSRMDKKIFTKAVAVEKEADVMLDHDYDGIKELDNALPPWWKYGFIITIGFALVYLLNFHFTGYGKNPTEEYAAEMAKAEEKKAAFEAKNVDRVDEANLKMPEKTGIDAGKTIYNSVCWTCHGKQGEGGAGPNLTDEYWIHKGSLTDIYLSIKHGYPEKGMQAWEKNYSPKEINNLAGFIKTLKGTNPPNPKAPEGELFTETAATDSAAVQPVKDVKPVTADSNAVPKK